MNNLKIAVIGCGMIGREHIERIQNRIKGAEVVAVCDVFEAGAQKGAEIAGAGVKVYTDFNAAINDPDVNAVVVTTPGAFHKDPVVAAVKAGKPVFSEKPLANTAADCKEIVDAEVASGKHLVQVGFMRRFDPGHVAAKKMIESGACGKPIYIHDCQRDPNGPPPAYVPQSGGLFVDMGIHDLDVARWLMGCEITEIYAQGAVLKHEFLKELNDVDDGQMLLKFENGGLGMIEISRNANDVYDTRTEVIGLDKSVFVGQDQLTPYTVVGGQQVTVDMANWCLGRFKDAYELEMQAFVDHVRANEPSPVTAYDGMMGIKLALTATASYRAGRRC